jgi:hypothetical protein
MIHTSIHGVDMGFELSTDLMYSRKKKTEYDPQFRLGEHWSRAHLQVTLRAASVSRLVRSGQGLDQAQRRRDGSVSVCNMVRVYVRSSTPTIHVHLMYCHVGGFSLLYITRNRWPERVTHRYTKTNSSFFAVLCGFAECFLLRTR